MRNTPGCFALRLWEAAHVAYRFCGSHCDVGSRSLVMWDSRAVAAPELAVGAGHRMTESQAAVRSRSAAQPQRSPNPLLETKTREWGVDYQYHLSFKFQVSLLAPR